MLSTAALRLIDRLVTAVMTLVRAVAPGDTLASTPTPAEVATHTLFFHLIQLVNRLIRIRTFGLRTPTKPNPAAPTRDQPTPAAPPCRPTQTTPLGALPRRPGWLLAALPEIADPIAAEIGALLADPAIANLLDLAPALNRALRPLLRALGLEIAPPGPTPPHPPSPTTTPPGTPPPTGQTADSRPHIKTRPTNRYVFSRRIRYGVVMNTSHNRQWRPPHGQALSAARSTAPIMPM